MAGPPSNPGLPVVRVVMTDRDIVERVATLWHRAAVPLRVRQPDHKRPYATTIKGSPAADLMHIARPLLSVRRQAQIDRALASWNGQPPRWSSSLGHCIVAGCTREARRKGLCKQHYHQWWKSRRRGRTRAFAPVAPASQWDWISSEACTHDCEVSWLVRTSSNERVSFYAAPESTDAIART